MTPEREQEIVPGCTGPFSDARDCPVHRPVSREEQLLAKLDALRAKQREFREWLNQDTMRALAAFDRIFGELR